MRTGDKAGRADRHDGRFPWHWLAAGALVLLLAAMTPGCGGGGGDDGGGNGGGGMSEDGGDDGSGGDSDGGGVDDGSGTSDGGDGDGDDGSGSSDGGDDGDAGGGEPLTESQMRLQFINTIGNGFILPTYTAMVAEASDLIDSAAAFCAAPTESNLSTAQDQWRRVAGLWMESELVKFGPAVQDLVHDNIDAPRGGHANANGIESRIERGDIDPDDPASARRLPVNQRGLEGIEYLLFGDDGEGAAMLDTSDPFWDQRCDYLEAIVDNLHANMETILTGWQASDDGGDYIGAWNSAGDTGNSTYRFVQDAVKELMGEMEFVLDDLVNVKLAGHRQGARRPWADRKPESWRSDNSIANIRHRIEAAEMIYLGIDRDTDQDGFGIDDYLQQTGEGDLDTRIRAEFDEALAALDAIPGTLEDAVVSNLAFVDDAEADSRTLLRTLKRDLTVDQLDVFFPGFNDADGD